MFLAEQAATTGYGAYIGQTIGVLALLALLAWILARFVAPRLRGAGGRSRLRVVERLPLEPRRSLYVVEVDGEPMLLGVADGSVRLIKELSLAATAEAPEDPAR